MPGKSSPKDWDFAAPEAILKASGGAITNLDNSALSYGNLNFEQTGVIVASNNFQNHENICLEIGIIYLLIYYYKKMLQNNSAGEKYLK